MLMVTSYIFWVKDSCELQKSKYLRNRNYFYGQIKILCQWTLKGYLLGVKHFLVEVTLKGTDLRFKFSFK